MVIRKTEIDLFTEKIQKETAEMKTEIKYLPWQCIRGTWVASNI